MEDKALIRYHKTPQQRAEVVANYQQSGLGLNEFADRHGLARTTLLKWVQHAREGAAEPRAQLVEVPNLLAGEPRASGYRLHCGRGWVLELNRGFDLAEVRSLVQALQSL